MFNKHSYEMRHILCYIAYIIIIRGTFYKPNSIQIYKGLLDFCRCRSFQDICIAAVYVGKMKNDFIYDMLEK